LTLPVGIGLIVLAESALERDPVLPLVRSMLLDWSPSLATTIGGGLGVFLLGLLFTWTLIRDMPVRNNPA
jgi:hypothetical protein